jgi:hypothetical protein
MIGLVLSEIILFVIAIAIGFVAGWRLRAYMADTQNRASEDELIALRSAITEAQVRRAARA